VAGNTFGTLFRITTFGESHGTALGVTVDGCPAGIPLDEAVVQKELDRRRPGAHAAASDGTPDLRGGRLNPAMTSRKEADSCEILSGVFEGKTTGTPIAIIVRNTNQKSEDYGDIAFKYRPGHADYPFRAKYGVRDYRGGGRSSGRETIGRVAAGAIARAVLEREGIAVRAWTSEAVGIPCETFDEAVIELNAMRACDSAAAEKMLARIIELKAAGDSGGGIISCRISGLPAGLGEPVFDKLDADLARALMGIGTVKGVEIGAGFAAAAMKGSRFNDPIGPAGFASNHAGGVLAGISNGEAIVLRAACKPIPSIGQPQETVDVRGNPATLAIRGRHDVCVIPRILPVCEAMVCLVLADHLLRQKAIRP